MSAALLTKRPPTAAKLLQRELTPKQRRLRIEINEIASIIAMGHWNILDYPPEARTVHLEIMNNKFVTAEIVFKYTLIDEYLTVIICHFYFKRPDRNRTFRQLSANCGPRRGSPAAARTGPAARV